MKNKPKMKFSLWTTICSVIFFFYSLWLKDNIFSIYFVTEVPPYTFNETIKVTICSPLSMFDDQCKKSGFLTPKLDEFSCESLQIHPLSCLTKNFEKRSTRTIIQTLEKCDQSLIFGSNLRLEKYNKSLHTDFAINQQPLKSYPFDYVTHYLNNGDYCGTFVFESFVQKEKKANDTQKVVYQFVLEKLHSTVYVNVNQDETNVTYLNFPHAMHRYIDEEFWAIRNEDMERIYPDFLEPQNVTESPLSDLDGASANATRNSSTSKSIWRTTKYYIPPQNMTVYVSLLHSRVIYLGYPYLTDCFDYFANSRAGDPNAIRSKDECIMSCYKTYGDNKNFLYTLQDDDKMLQSGVIINPFCEQKCKRSNCKNDLFHVQKISVTFNDGGDEFEDLLKKPKSDRSLNQTIRFNYKIRLQLNEWIRIIEAKPVITPLVAINYVFGLLNVFLGTNLVHFSYKLIHLLIRLKRLTFGSMKNQKKRERADSLPKNYSVPTGDWNLMVVQHILNKKIQKFNPKNSPRKGRSFFRTKLNRIKSLIGSLRYDKLVNFNQLFCFYLLIILSVVLAGPFLRNMRKVPQVEYSDLLRAVISEPVSVSFCFDFRVILPKNVTEEINKVILDNSNRRYTNPSFRNTSLNPNEEHGIRLELKAKYLNLLYSKYSLGEIDAKTPKVEGLLDSVYLGFKEFGFKADYKNESLSDARRTIYDLHSLKPLVFYFHDSKCVKFFFNRTDYLFVYDIESSFALFDFKVPYEKYYLEPDDQLPSQNSTSFVGWVELQVTRFLNDSSLCMRFESYEPCKSKEDCESQCIQANYTAQFSGITVNHPIVLDESNEFLHFHNKNNATRNEQQLKCEFDFEQTCRKVKFWKFTSGMRPPKEVMINLSNDIYQTRVMNRFKTIDFINLMLNIGSLIFNVNMTTTIDYLVLLVLLVYYQISDYLGRALGRVLPIDSGRARTVNRRVKSLLKKFLKLLKIVILVFGFSVHLFYAVDSYVFGQQFRSSTYMSRPNTFRVPNMTICIGNEFVSYLSGSQTQSDYFSKKGEFTNKTGNELVGLFPTVRQTLFKIEYRDENLQTIILNDTGIGELEENGQFKKNLYLSTFFIEQSKCSTFYLDLTYRSFPFCLFDAVFPIRFKFRPLNKTKFHYTIFLPDREKYSFRNPIPLRENMDYYFFFDSVKIYYDNELMARNYITNTFTKNNVFDFGSQAAYLERLRSEFKLAENMATTSIPLTEAYFDLPIDNNKFQKFYETNILEHEEEVIFMETEKLLFRSLHLSFDSNNLTRIALVPQYLQQATDYSNNISISETILYIGTVLSFWLNTCYLDLFAYLRRLIKSCKCCSA